MCPKFGEILERSTWDWTMLLSVDAGLEYLSAGCADGKIVNGMGEGGKGRTLSVFIVEHLEMLAQQRVVDCKEVVVDVPNHLPDPVVQTTTVELAGPEECFLDGPRSDDGYHQRQFCLALFIKQLRECDHFVPG